MSMAVFLVSLLAGAVASVAGFGIGSFVTPVIALSTGTGLAVAAVSFIHFFGTLLRFFFWRAHINKKILIEFGIASAVGGLVGALLHNVLFSNALTTIFGCLLVFAGITGVTGLAERIRFRGVLSYIAGILSGFFGGLVGNQGGIRSAAMLNFELDQKAFVATATGIALIVDIVRMPVYTLTQSNDLIHIVPVILTGTVGVLLGTLLGGILLKKIPAQAFKRIVSGIILLVGIFILF